MDVAGAEHPHAAVEGRGPAENDLGFEGILGAGVDRRDDQLLAGERGRPGQPPERAGLPRRVGPDARGGELRPQRLSALVRRVHLEDVEVRRRAEAVLAGQEERVEIVDELGDVGHDDLVGVAVERVEGQGRDERVAHGRHLAEEIGRVDLRPSLVPGAPLVDGQLDPVSGIDLGHGRPMLGDEGSHDVGFPEQVVPVVKGEVDGLALARRAAIIMEAPAEDAAEEAAVPFGQLGEETARPFEVASRRTGGDERQRDAVVGDPGDEAPEFRGVLLGREVAAATPGFVADAPIAHPERIGVAVRGPLVGERRLAARRITVVDPGVEVRGGQAAHVGGEVRLGADEPTEADELVGAERVGVVLLRTVGGGPHLPRVDPEIGPARAGGARPDAVAPVVAVGEAAAGPADDGGLDALHVLDEVAADAADVGDGRVLADPDAVIDDAADVLGEMAVDRGRYRADGLADDDLDLGVGGAGRAGKAPGDEGERPERAAGARLDEFAAAEESAALHGGDS